MEEFIKRCEKAIADLQPDAEWNYFNSPLDFQRLRGKIEGLKLAISYAREMVSAPPPEPPPPPKQPKTG